MNRPRLCERQWQQRGLHRCLAQALPAAAPLPPPHCGSEVRTVTSQMRSTGGAPTGTARCPGFLSTWGWLQRDVSWLSLYSWEHLYPGFKWKVSTHIFKIKDFHFFCCSCCSARTTVGLTLAEQFHVCQSNANLCLSSIWTSLFWCIVNSSANTYSQEPAWPGSHLVPKATSMSSQERLLKKQLQPQRTELSVCS